MIVLSVLIHLINDTAEYTIVIVAGVFLRGGRITRSRYFVWFTTLQRLFVSAKDLLGW